MPPNGTLSNGIPAVLYLIAGPQPQPKPGANPIIGSIPKPGGNATAGPIIGAGATGAVGIAATGVEIKEGRRLYTQQKKST